MVTSTSSDSENVCPAEQKELIPLAEGKARLQSQHLLADPDPALLKPLRESRLRDYYHTTSGVKGGKEGFPE